MSKDRQKRYAAKDEAMPEAIIAMAEQVAQETWSDPGESPEFDANLRAILDILCAKVGHDFRCYKPSTLVRRIRRRMTLGKIATFADYARFLDEHPDEVGLLQKDLLIGVTEFFRQPQAWQVLEEKVVTALVENSQPGSEIRVWVPGCSTGKEAYSLAMLLDEQVEKSGKKVGIQIFATDPDAAALTSARSGSYSEKEIGKNVSPDRLKRFFACKDGRYQVIKEVREQIVFAFQNLTADPPFSRLDLISCRNLLIYLDQQVQHKIVALFHFALREGGFLFLGTAETVGDREELFEPVSKKWRIYRRIGIGRPVSVEIPVRPTGEPPPADFGELSRVAGKPPVAASTSRMSLASAAQQMLRDRYAPACVMIDRKFQVLYVHGVVEDYLTFPAGELTTRVVDMAREGLRARLRGAISRCLEVSKSVSVSARVRRGERSVPVKATVSPLRYPREADGLLLITFEDHRVPAAKSRWQAAGESDVQQLQDELKVTREELQSTIEQLENSNDQLKASNEEVTAANEELQSANEELETSKEELQSLNEEINTINARLLEKVDELESTNNDLVNLLSSTSIATVFLDKDLKVKRYTPAITRLLSLIPSDVGRPIADILLRFSDEALLDHSRRVLADLTPLAKEVQGEDGRWYIRRITPYRTQDDRIEGVVVTFVDVSDLKQAEEALRQRTLELQQLTGTLEERVQERTIELAKTNEGLQAEIAERKRAEEAVKAERQRFNDVLETLPAYVVLLTPDYHVPFANRFFRERFGESHGQRCFEYLFNRTEACETCETYTVLKTKGPYRWEWTGPDGRNYDIYDFPFTDTDGSTLILEMGIDITEIKRAEAALKEANETLEQRVAERTAALRESERDLNRAQAVAHTGSWRLDVRRNELLWSDETHRLFGIPKGVSLTYETFLGAVHPDDRDYLDRSWKAALGGEPYDLEHRIIVGGEVKWVRERAELEFDPQGILLGGFGTVQDITERKQAEEAIRQRTSELQQLTENLEQRVQERTAELGRTNEALRHLSSRLLSAQEEERKRIAGEIHDTLGTSLSAIKFKVDSALREFGATANLAAQSLQSISPVIQESIEDCRRIQMDLRPSILDDLGLLATFSWFFRRFQTIYAGVRIEQEIEIEESDVPAFLKIVAFRVTQEAMNNVAKHSKADLVRLSFRKANRSMELTIQDNGQGFSLEKALVLEGTRRGLGLSSMRERVELSGGSFDIESIEGKGTIIRASWPLPENG